MTLGERLKTMRRDTGLSQEAFGSQGFISTPGWIKIESGQRQASEKLIDRVLRWMVEGKHLRSSAANALKEELLTLKYMGSNSQFVRNMAKSHAKTLSNGGLLLAEESGGYKTKPRRGRPPKRK